MARWFSRLASVSLQPRCALRQPATNLQLLESKSAPGQRCEPNKFCSNYSITGTNAAVWPTRTWAQFAATTDVEQHQVSARVALPLIVPKGIAAARSAVMNGGLIVEPHSLELDASPGIKLSLGKLTLRRPAALGVRATSQVGRGEARGGIAHYHAPGDGRRVLLARGHLLPRRGWQGSRR